MFQKVLESPIIKKHTGIMHREAVRAIICTNNNILLGHSDKGYYKFPGGGVKENESYFQALVREVKEETGYINCIIKDLMGVVIELKMDEFVNGHVFQMTSHYYLCEFTNDETIAQELDEYEYILNLFPNGLV